MKFTETKLKDIYLIKLDKHSDERGFFARQFCSHEFAEHNLSQQFVQVNNSFNLKKHTLRGMHYQLAPYGETKLVRCIQGALLDIVIDMRPSSPTFKQWLTEELTAENRHMLYISKGFAHGYLTLTDNTELFYFIDEFYMPDYERGIRWEDPEFTITLPYPPVELSEKDSSWPYFDSAYHLGQA